MHVPPRPISEFSYCCSSFCSFVLLATFSFLLLLLISSSKCYNGHRSLHGRCTLAVRSPHGRRPLPTPTSMLMCRRPRIVKQRHPRAHPRRNIEIWGAGAMTLRRSLARFGRSVRFRSVARSVFSVARSRSVGIGRSVARLVGSVGRVGRVGSVGRVGRQSGQHYSQHYNQH